MAVEPLGVCCVIPPCRVGRQRRKLEIGTEEEIWGWEPKDKLLVHRWLLEDSTLPTRWRSRRSKPQQEGFRLDLNLTNTWHKR